jgi:hypothetical protein
MARIPKGTRTKAQQAEATGNLLTFRANVLNFLDTSRDLRLQIDEDFRFNRGGRAQWNEDDAKSLDEQKRPVESFNACAPVVNFLAGYVWERRKDGVYYPRGTEDETIGRLATALSRYAMDAGQGDEQLHRHFRKGAIGGLSSLYLCLNYDYSDDLVEGELDYQLLPENSFGYSPYSRRYDRNDSDFYYMMYWLSLEEAQRTWPNHKQILASGYINDWFQADEANTGVPTQIRQVFYNKDTQQVRIVRYFYRKPVEVVLLANHATQDYQRMGSEKEAEQALQQIYDTAGAQAASNFSIQTADSQSALIAPTGQMQVFATPEEAQQSLDMLTAQAGAAATKDFEIVTRPTTTMRLAHLVGWDELDDKPSPYGPIDQATGEVIPDWRFPFVTFVPYQDTDDFLSIKGVVRDIKDPQRNINWYLSTAQDKLVRGPKGMLWVLKGEHTDINKLQAQVSRAGFIGEYAGKVPDYIPPPPIAQEDLVMVQTMLEAVMRITGINAELLGQTTQKTVSGRSIQARQAGGLVGVSSLLVNWTASQKYFYDLLIRRIQQFYSVAKMNRIIGDDQRMAQAMGLFGQQQVMMPNEQVFDMLKRLKDVDFDVVVEFQDHAPTARQAVVAQMMQFMAAGMPIPPDIIIEASDVPRKDEIQAALKKSGMGPPNPELAKALSAGQGQTASQPDGVNR